MEVHIYPCPFRTGCIYCDIRANDRKLYSVHDNALNAYIHCQHLDVSGTNFNIDVPGENLEKLREKLREKYESLQV